MYYTTPNTTPISAVRACEKDCGTYCLPGSSCYKNTDPAAPKGYNCKCFLDGAPIPTGWEKKLTEMSTDEMYKIQLLQARQAANFVTNSTMGGLCDSCLGNQCVGGTTCWHRQTGTDTRNIKWECKCVPLTGLNSNPNLPTPGGWIPKFFDKPSASVKIRPNQMF